MSIKNFTVTRITTTDTKVTCHAITLLNDIQSMCKFCSSIGQIPVLNSGFAYDLEEFSMKFSMDDNLEVVRGMQALQQYHNKSFLITIDQPVGDTSVVAYEISGKYIDMISSSTEKHEVTVVFAVNEVKLTPRYKPTVIVVDRADKIVTIRTGEGLKAISIGLQSIADMAKLGINAVSEALSLSGHDQAFMTPKMWRIINEAVIESTADGAYNFVHAVELAYMTSGDIDVVSNSKLYVLQQSTTERLKEIFLNRTKEGTFSSTTMRIPPDATTSLDDFLANFDVVSVFGDRSSNNLHLEQITSWQGSDNSTFLKIEYRY